jgi:hypothetical protein
VRRKGFIKVTTFDEKVKVEERKPKGTCLVNVDEIAVILCTEVGNLIVMKDYATKVYVLDSESDLQRKINAAAGGEA